MWDGGHRADQAKALAKPWLMQNWCYMTLRFEGSSKHSVYDLRDLILFSFFYMVPEYAWYL